MRESKQFLNGILDGVQTAVKSVAFVGWGL